VLGDREVTWTDGKAMSEKRLTAALQVHATPTLVFFDEDGRIVQRASGFIAPREFEALLERASGPRAGSRSAAPPGLPGPR
jgi:thioredoxin-related protein